MRGAGFIPQSPCPRLILSEREYNLEREGKLVRPVPAYFQGQFLPWREPLSDEEYWALWQRETRNTLANSLIPLHTRTCD